MRSVVSSGVCLVNVRHGRGKGALEVTIYTSTGQLCIVGSTPDEFQLEHNFIPTVTHMVGLLAFV